MHKNYPSHVTKEQFKNIKSILENSKKKIKPRSLDLYEVFFQLCRKVGILVKFNFLYGIFNIKGDFNE